MDINVLTLMILELYVPNAKHKQDGEDYHREKIFSTEDDRNMAQGFAEN